MNGVADEFIAKYEEQRKTIGMTTSYCGIQSLELISRHLSMTLIS